MSILVPFQSSEIELIERKSRFIGNIWIVESETEARERIAETAAKHYSASHGVYAYDIKSENASRFSDAGEPKGTAGMPVYEVFRREDITNYCCVVTRYFGGILLGAGGLIRAYSSTASEALAAAGVAELRPYITIAILCEYTYFDIVRAFLRDYEHTVIDTEYGADVLYSICISEEDVESVREGIVNLSAGRAEIMETGIELKPYRIK
ncbi:MAG: DUF1949 domain-containing protein [Clostridiales bacterium]|jgi:uncharacterized YigZ family protein|nr:DUF1949 domain-containing protein [Clostridiales bacterium]